MYLILTKSHFPYILTGYALLRLAYPNPTSPKNTSLDQSLKWLVRAFIIVYQGVMLQGPKLTCFPRWFAFIAAGVGFC